MSEVASLLRPPPVASGFRPGQVAVMIQRFAVSGEAAYAPSSHCAQLALSACLLHRLPRRRYLLLAEAKLCRWKGVGGGGGVSTSWLRAACFRIKRGFRHPASQVCINCGIIVARCGERKRLERFVLRGSARNRIVLGSLCCGVYCTASGDQELGGTV